MVKVDNGGVLKCGKVLGIVRIPSGHIADGPSMDVASSFLEQHEAWGVSTKRYFVMGR